MVEYTITGGPLDGQTIELREGASTLTWQHDTIGEKLPDGRYHLTVRYACYQARPDYRFVWTGLGEISNEVLH